MIGQHLMDVWSFSLAIVHECPRLYCSGSSTVTLYNLASFLGVEFEFFEKKWYSMLLDNQELQDFCM